MAPLALLLGLGFAGAAFAQAPASAAAAKPPRVAHVLVALADNQFQGIVPVPPAIGNGDDFNRNLYWGAGYGVPTFFKRSADWELVAKCVTPLTGAAPADKGRGGLTTSKNSPPPRSVLSASILERCVFRNRYQPEVYVVADAYRGREIKQSISDFFAFAAGKSSQKVRLDNGEFVNAAGSADLVAFVGHDGLMDFKLDGYHYAADSKRRDAMMLSCASKSYFADALRWTGANPLVWTTGLMAPEAYVIEAALAGWARDETGEQIRARAAQAYDKYQHTGPKAASNLFATGWGR